MSAKSISARPAAARPETAAVRLDQLQDVLNFATARYGADSAAARLLSAEIARLARDIPAVNDDRRPQPAAAQISLGEGLFKSPVLMVGLGATVVMALMGFSTMFIGMLAAKWLAL